MTLKAWKDAPTRQFCDLSNTRASFCPGRGQPTKSWELKGEEATRIFYYSFFPRGCWIVLLQNTFSAISTPSTRPSGPSRIDFTWCCGKFQTFLVWTHRLIAEVERNIFVTNCVLRLALSSDTCLQSVLILASDYSPKYLGISLARKDIHVTF